MRRRHSVTILTPLILSFSHDGEKERKLTLGMSPLPLWERAG